MERISFEARRHHGNTAKTPQRPAPHNDPTTPTRGDIFRGYLQADMGRQPLKAKEWLLRLSDNNRKRIRQLKQPVERNLLAAFLELLPYAALWTSFQVGTLNRILPMRCREVSSPGTSDEHS